MAKKKREDVVHNIIESVAKKADKIFKKSTEKKSSPHMSVDQIADRADKEAGAYLEKVMSGKGLKGGGRAVRGLGKAFMKGGKV